MKRVRYKIKVIEGVLESHGQGLIDLDIGAKRDVVFQKSDNTTERVKILGTLGMLSNYTSPGASGKFHILEFTPQIKMLIGIERDDGRKITDVEAYEAEYNKCKSMASSANFLTFLGILFIPVFLIGFVLISQASSMKKQSQPFLKFTPEEIKEYLAEEKIIS